MAFNAIDAARTLDESILTKPQLELLLSLRDGVAFEEIRETDEYEELKALGFIKKVPMSHPRVSASVYGVAPTDDGVTLLNEIDKRYREADVGRAVRPYETTPQNADVSEIKGNPYEQSDTKAATQSKTAAKKVIKEAKE